MVGSPAIPLVYVQPVLRWLWRLDADPPPSYYSYRVRDVRTNRDPIVERLMETRCPEITVRLVGEDGNAFAILGRVREALRRGGVNSAERDAFFTEATSGDYDNLLQVCMKWVNVE